MVEKIKIFRDMQITLTFTFQCCFTGTQPRPLAYTRWLFGATAAAAVTDSARLQRLERSLSGPLERKLANLVASAI